ncbi:UvrD-helicase domain-containing protein [Geoalkalibacter halelectricus]|uniref:DNA 3'-5' helicase n=1 Tax=Geoalkalibacter halelectricus TaxID=2847045 RepID=A0ABY5ZK09_9BACT|nr:UvrD-helicase domain-containing protein [Geoalkalibacter halelectricus]MDO3377180.1 UvrD-helicase domain-containing protein [Geoalkalibacter halelectricus]UWZ79468.1 UvrD-helicase domain-containing protein [Geoalkalibacter halelectricus]
MKNLTLISAGAGSGKTYRITHLLKDELLAEPGAVRPSGVIATTFTRKAADELVERVRGTLAEAGRFDLAAAMSQAWIGTVNSVCGQLLSRYAFAAGLSPELRVVDEKAVAFLFSQALESALDDERITGLNRLTARLGIEDWRQKVKELVDLVRGNGIDPATLPEAATGTADELLGFFARPTATGADEHLLAALRQAVAEISENGDKTVDTGKYLESIQTELSNLADDRMPWSAWVKLTKPKTGARSREIASRVAEAALAYENHPRLHADLREWIGGIFEAARLALSAYDEFKQERGLIDFVDQEQKVLELLDDPEVAESLREELDLLLVDEFQDTSPLQLAVFLKLMALAKKSVWVGDVKQAIYGFRGCDPELMKAVVDELRKQGGPLEVLPTSYRSQATLVHLANDLFVPAFADILPADEVRLQPDRPEVGGASALEHWTLGGKNQDLVAQSLADGVYTLMGEGRIIVDKESNQLRPLRFGDIAVLCRKNDGAAKQAEALIARGLPVSIGKAGLLATPEATLSLACLRRLHDPADSLAAAEIVSLRWADGPETWLAERMRSLAEGERGGAWLTEGPQADPVLAALEAERAQLAVLSPSEALELAIRLGDVEQRLHAWGPSVGRARERLANLGALRDLALTYVDYCRQSDLAATVAGLLLWLQGLAEAGEDFCAAESGGDAIQVLTHHGAKGLEWPVVILCDLHFLKEGELWEMQMVPRREGFDLAAPLAGRTLHYWPWPFGKQKTGIAVDDRIAATEAAREIRERQRAEDLRLLYVSITRARDLLVLTRQAKQNSLPWLDLLGAEWLTPTSGTLTLPGGETIPCVHREFEPVEGAAADDGQRPALAWFAGRRPHQPRPLRELSPSSMECADAAIGRIIDLGSRLPINGKPEMDHLGTLIHDLLAAEFSGALGDQASERCAELLAANGLSGVVRPDEAAVLSRRLRDTLQREFAATAFHPEWPIACDLGNGQRLNGWIDLLVATPQGWLIVDHKSFPGRREDWSAQALAYAGQLAAYRRAVTEATGQPVLGTWIHFCIGGGLVEVLGD